MKRARAWAVVFLGGALALLGPSAATCLNAQEKPAAAAATESARHFETRIVPLLTRHCLECHGPSSKKGRLDLSQKGAAMSGGKSGPAIEPGKAEASLLWQYVDAGEMPPDSRPPLSPEEKLLLRHWIDAGAVWSVPRIGTLTLSDERIERHHEFQPTGDRRDPGPILLRRLTVPEYIETVRSAVGVDIAEDARKMLPPDLRADGFSNTAYNLHVDLANVEAYARLAERIVQRLDVMEFAARHAPAKALQEARSKWPTRSAKERKSPEQMRAVIAAIGEWLLRGPLEEHEVAAFVGLSDAVVEERGNFTEAVSYLVEAMLQSPRFLYRLESHRGDGSPRRVGDFELASRLSYILWGAPPDKELLRAAGAGELADRAKAAAQVERMLKDPRAVERSARFIHEWMNLDQLSSLRPGKERFPAWDSQLAADMREETLAFFKHIAWEEKRPLSDLMNAQVTFATPALARHYGLDLRRSDTPSRLVLGVPERVKGGLQALYTFEEGRGDTVRDVSGAGEPIHLKIADAAAVRWSDQGLSVNSSTLIASERAPKRLIDAVKKSRAITLEVWITPANASQTGPARIVTLSQDPNGRNFTLGQFGDRFDTRLRTTSTSGNGEPSLTSLPGTAGASRVHVAYTRDAAGKARVYVDGQEKGALDVGGDFSNWDGAFRLALANELTKDRPWQGTLHLAAIYDRALSVEEVRRNRAAGARRDEALALASVPSERSERVGRDLQALYTFQEGGGDTVRDISGAGEPLHLKIDNPSAVAWSGGRLKVNGPTRIATAGPPKRLIDAVKKSKAITLEAWIAPADTGQSGPARILTLSANTLQRNFTLGQDGDKYEVRFRGQKTDASGLPALVGASGGVAARLSHVVYTRDAAGKARLYVNGEPNGAHDVAGDLANWDNGHRLALANELTNDRPWRGEYRLVALYSRALSLEEVRQNHAAGVEAGADFIASASEPRVADGLQTLYRFNEGGGDTVRDVSGAGEPLNLKVANASAVAWTSDGLQVNGSTLIASAGAPKRLIDAVKQSKALTLEAWVTPGDARQSGPARILSLSSGIGQRNFTLGQEGDKFDVRLRATRADANGMPSLASPSGAVSTRRMHVVYTRDAAGKARLYVDGQEKGSRDVGGDLSNWDNGFRLALANETSGDRPWKGTLHLVAIYQRALSAEEVRRNHAAGTAFEGGGRGARGALVRYDLSATPARGGLLTQGSALTIGGDEASMVTRGLFVLNDILSSGVEDPPPCVDTTPVPIKPGRSQRDVALERLASSSCGGCHGKFEPLAFGLEKFDGIGAYHEKDEHGNTLREDGEVLFPGQERPVSFASTAELMDLLAASERVRETITLKVTQFALGRPLVKSDSRALAEIHKAAQEGGGTYASLITAIVLSDLVQMTRTEAREDEGS